MDLPKALIRSVVRAFYDTRHVLVIDALMVHSTHTRQETREGLQRPVNKDYYFIDYHLTVDAIKYRVLHLTTRVKQMFKPSEDKKDYCCPRCKAQWTQLEVLDRVGPLGFVCHRCGGILEREERTAGDAIGSEKQIKLAAQLSRVLKLLQKIDNTTIPKNDFEMALSLQIPVQRNRDVNPVREMIPVDATQRFPTAVRGINMPIVQDLTVDLTSSAEKTAAEKASDESRKALIAAQNALPLWHTQSTVPVGPSVDPDSEPLLTNGISTALQAESVGHDARLAASIRDESDELAAYYSRMAQEKEQEEQEHEDKASSDDDDSEDDFEDVSIDVTSSSSQSNIKAEEKGTFSSPASISARANDPVSESGSSAPGSTATTPAASLDDKGDVTGKRAKIEATNGSGTPQEISDEDDEAEFEDAL
ncbi:MAG: hypothetical protein Q9220_007779 [cf. Caloplaca sp. 1 TL-2023]